MGTKRVGKHWLVSTDDLLGIAPRSVGSESEFWLEGDPVQSVRPTRVHFSSGQLGLWGEVWRPSGADEQLPVILWNHSRKGVRQGLIEPLTKSPSVLERFLAMGFAVFAPARRGYDGAEGETLAGAFGSQDMSFEQGAEQLEKRLIVESDDVLAAADFLAEQGWLESQPLVCAGYGLGGIMTLLAAARSDRFAAGIAFSPGSALWHVPAVRNLVLSHAQQARVPVLVMQAENDYSLGPSEAISGLAKKGAQTVTVIHPAHGDSPQLGHIFFAHTGAWAAEVRKFLLDTDGVRTTYRDVRRALIPARCD